MQPPAEGCVASGDNPSADFGFGDDEFGRVEDAWIQVEWDCCTSR